MKFPQITRRFSALLFTAVFTLVMSVFYLLIAVVTMMNLRVWLFPADETYTKLKIASLVYPPTVAPLIELGDYLNIRGLKAQAEVQYKRAEALSREKNILGSQTEAKAQILNKNLQYWQDLIKSKPNYRDGYLQLALTYSQLGLQVEANEAFEKAKNLDPFF